LNEAVEESVRRYMGSTPGRAVYLGAGLGRHAFDGAGLFASVVAVELSFVAAALLSAVRAGPLRFSTPNWHGATSADDLIQSHEAFFPPPPYGRGCTYVVGDALSLPVADASVDAVVSIFFSDVTPASKLLPEVKRVLRPGGRFINVGPLEYHFKGRAERFTREELRRVFEEVHGLRFEPGERSFELPYMVAPGTVRTLFRVWSYVATRV
jgi:SAM-dependent methyltransferase